MSTAPFEPGPDPDLVPGDPEERPNPVAPMEPGGPGPDPSAPDRPDDPRPTES